jgi:hypothetical protein
MKTIECKSERNAEQKMFLSKLVFHISIDQHHNSEFDEQIRLIKASNEKSAYEKAKMLGLQNENSFVNENGKAITWKFIDVTELINMSDKENGDELYSSSASADCPSTYIESIRHKSTLLQLNHQMEFLS